MRLRAQQRLIGIYPQSEQDGSRRERRLLHIGAPEPHGRSMPIGNQAVVSSWVSVLFIDNVLEHAKMESQMRFRCGTKSADDARFILQLNRIGTWDVNRCGLQIRARRKCNDNYAGNLFAGRLNTRGGGILENRGKVVQHRTERVCRKHFRIVFEL